MKALSLALRSALLEIKNMCTDAQNDILIIIGDTLNELSCEDVRHRAHLLSSENPAGPTLNGLSLLLIWYDRAPSAYIRLSALLKYLGMCGLF